MPPRSARALGPMVLGALALAFATPAARGQAVEHPFSLSRLPERLPPLSGAALRWADFDGDGDLDLLAMGTAPGATPLAAPTPYTRLLRNGGRVPDAEAPGGVSVAFADAGAALPALASGDAAWGDIDRDGDLDLVLTGSRTAAPPYAPVTALFRNEAGRLVEDAGAALSALHGGVARFADADGDGDLDLLLTGTADVRAPYTPSTVLLVQTAGRFAPGGSGLPAAAFGDARWADADGDGDPDLLIGGLLAGGLGVRLYANAGGLRFEPRGAAGLLDGLVSPAFDLADADGDRTLDLALVGGRVSPFLLDGVAGIARVRADGPSALLPSRLEGRVGGVAAWGDLDGDGDLDLAATGGARPFSAYAADVYRNDGRAGDTLRLVPVLRLVPTFRGAAAWADVDGDGDLDLATAGTATGGRVETSLYRNDRYGRSAVPPAPTALAATGATGGAVLRWEAGGAASAPVSYSVYVGTAAALADVRAAPADLGDGARRLAAAGEADAPELRLSGLAPGRYHYGVQAVSGERVGSPFATGTFEVGAATGAEEAPGAFALALDAPRPHPARGAVRVAFRLPAAGPVRLALYDALGRRVLTLADGPLAPGAHARAFDAGPLAPGLYALRLDAPGGTRTASVVVAR